jgi:leucyl-tRNA synthetase
MQGVHGVRGFLDRTWRMIVDDRSETMERSAAVQDVEPTDEQNRVLHRTIMAVTRDIEQLQFNTAIARMMEFVNYFTKQATRPRRTMESFVLLVSPFAPHLAEELWEMLGKSQTLAYEAWPVFDESLTKEDTIEVPVQVGKKVRAKISVPADATQEQMEQVARSHQKVAELLEGKQIVKVIVIPGRLVNFVVK